MVLALCAAVLLPLELPLVGTNLAPVTPETTAWPFDDMTKWSSGWNTGKGSTFTVDEFGRLIQVAGLATMQIGGSKTPPGRYLVTWTGPAKMEVSDGGGSVASSEGRIEFQHSVSGPFSLSVRDVESGPIAVRVGMSPFTEPGPPGPNRVALQRLGFNGVLRLQNWLQPLEGSFPSLDSATYAGPAGVPLEIACQTAMQVNCDVWVVVPLAWSDAAVTRFAQAIESQLSPGRRVWVEAEVSKDGKWPEPAASRSRKVFGLFADKTGADRVVRIVSGPMGNNEAAEALLDKSGADVLAVDAWIGRNADKSSSPEEFFEALAVETAGPFTEEVASMVALCRSKGKKLVSYEGGIKFDDGTADWASDSRTSKAMLAMLKAWRSKGGSTFVHWMHCSPEPGAALAYQDQPTDVAPIHSALLQFALFPDE